MRNSLRRALTMAFGFVAFVSCKDTANESASERLADMPLMPVSVGDIWTYEARLRIPQGVTSPGSGAIDTKRTVTRRYLGKTRAAEGLPEVDCFEVSTTGFPSEREFVEIQEDRVFMRGSLVMRPESGRPLWLDQPILLVQAGMKPGDGVGKVIGGDGAILRTILTTARVPISINGRKHSAIEVSMVGRDGDLFLDRVLWFVPGVGIVREAKVRRRGGIVIFDETQDLLSAPGLGEVKMDYEEP